MFVIKINWEKGTIVTSDVNVAANEFNVKGFKCISTSGETPNKFGWFRLLDFHKLKDDIIAHFNMGKDCSKFIEFGPATDAELKLFLVKPVKK